MEWRKLLDFQLILWSHQILRVTHISFHILSFITPSEQQQNKAKNDLPPSALARNAVILQQTSKNKRSTIPRPPDPILVIVLAFTSSGWCRLLLRGLDCQGASVLLFRTLLSISFIFLRKTSSTAPRPSYGMLVSRLVKVWLSNKKSEQHRQKRWASMFINQTAGTWLIELV